MPPGVQDESGSEFGIVDSDAESSCTPGLEILRELYRRSSVPLAKSNELFLDDRMLMECAGHLLSKTRRLPYLADVESNLSY